MVFRTRLSLYREGDGNIFKSPMYCMRSTCCVLRMRCIELADAVTDISLVRVDNVEGRVKCEYMRK